MILYRIEVVHSHLPFQINDNVSQNTRGLIKDLLLEQDVDELTQMILINAIYFKGKYH